MKFCRVECDQCHSGKGRNFIGAHQIDTPCVSQHLCQHCGTLWEYRTGPDGIISSKIVSSKKKKRHIEYETVMVVRL